MITLRSAPLGSMVSDRQWCRLVWAAALRFTPRCVWPAAALVVAQTLIILTTLFCEDQLGKLKVSGFSNFGAGDDLMRILVFLLVAMLTLVVCLIVNLVALSNWLTKLTVFSRLLVLLESNAAQMSIADIDSGISAAEQEVKRRAGYIIKTWLVASIYLLVPSLLLCALIAVIAVKSEPMIQSSGLQLSPWLIEPMTQSAAIVGAIILTVMILLYSCVTIVFSSVSDLRPAATAIAALKESVRNAGPLFAVTALTFAANVLITNPQTLLALAGLKSIPGGTITLVILQLWFGLSSLVVWPLSMAPYCRMTCYKEGSET